MGFVKLRAGQDTADGNNDWDTGVGTALVLGRCNKMWGEA